MQVVLVIPGGKSGTQMEGKLLTLGSGTASTAAARAGREQVRMRAC